VKDVFLIFDVNRMAGVIAALGSHHHVSLLREDVDDFAFAFIAPLGADEYRIGHSLKTECRPCHLERLFSEEKTERCQRNKNPRTQGSGQSIQSLPAETKKAASSLSTPEIRRSIGAQCSRRFISRCVLAVSISVPGQFDSEAA
jgi:hypothetical protein